MTAEVDDSGVLNFIVNYNLFVKKVKTSTPMGDYDYQSKLKG